MTRLLCNFMKTWLKSERFTPVDVQWNPPACLEEITSLGLVFPGQYSSVTKLSF